MSKDILGKEFELFNLGTGGIGDWLTKRTDKRVFKRIALIDKKPITRTQLNQLLVLGHQAPITDGFFQYYWNTAPLKHPYSVSAIIGFQAAWIDSSVITSLAHFKWGFYRLFIDGLLWFGNVQEAFRSLRDMSFTELTSFFEEKRFNTELMKERGSALGLYNIAKDDRYLISEMACKSYGDKASTPGELKDALMLSFRNYKENGGITIKIRQLLEGDIVVDKYGGRQQEFVFSADDVLEESVSSEEELEIKYGKSATIAPGLGNT